MIPSPAAARVATTATAWIASLAAPAAAQSLRWDLPQVGAAAWRIESSSFRVFPPERLAGARFEPAVARGAEGGPPWRHHSWNGVGPEGWTQTRFDDSAWGEAAGPFTSDGNGHFSARELGIRGVFDLGRRRPAALLFELRHDDAVRIFLNGVEVGQRSQTGNPAYVSVTGDGLDAWKRGDNTLAVQCTNTGGPGALDVGVLVCLRPPAGLTEDLAAWWAKQQKGAADVQRQAYAGYRCPPVLLSGELDADRQRVDLPIIDLRDFGWWLATDLSSGPRGGAIGRSLPRIVRFGDVHFQGKAQRADSAGWQELEVSMRGVEPDATVPGMPESSDGHMRSSVRPSCRLGVEGEFTIRRRWQENLAERTARILEFEFELRGTLSPGRGDVAYPFVQRERWVFDGIRQRDGDFRTAVARAIESGTAFLKKKLSKPGHRDVGPSTAGNRSYPSGRLAIALLALIKGDVPRDDKVLAGALAALRTRELIDTYSLGNALMALEAFYAPKGEFQDLMSGRIDRPRRRELTADDQKLARRWADQILANRDTSVDQGYRLRFNYIGGRRYDHSVNQYGLLGLYSAHLCGVELSSLVWEAAANHLVEAQCRSEPRLDLRLGGPPTPGETTEAGAIPCLPAGWHYYGPGNDGNPSAPCGSMTTAGLTGLTICQAALADYDIRRLKLVAGIERARHAGFGWFARHMTVRYNPGWVNRQPRWVYYYLYGLERSCVLSSVHTINGRDWYFEGATMLLALQAQDGSWPAEANGDDVIERTAMAVLFLKRASLPVVTGR